MLVAWRSLGGRGLERCFVRQPICQRIKRRVDWVVSTCAESLIFDGAGPATHATSDGGKEWCQTERKVRD